MPREPLVHGAAFPTHCVLRPSCRGRARAFIGAQGIRGAFMGAATTPVPGTTLGEQDPPPLFQVSDRWALRHQSDSFRAVRTHMILLLLATTAAVLTEQASGHVMTVLAAVLYGLTIAL